MAEIIVVIAVIGVLAGVVIPIYTGVREASQEVAAVQSAKLINAARETYALTVPGAQSAWSAAADDNARLQLLIAHNFLGGQPSQYLAMDGNYSVDLSGGLRAATILMRKGAPVAYH
jgi:type II secretory pathway pseudopilin PulG